MWRLWSTVWKGTRLGPSGRTGVLKKGLGFLKHNSRENTALVRGLGGYGYLESSFGGRWGINNE